MNPLSDYLAYRGREQAREWLDEIGIGIGVVQKADVLVVAVSQVGLKPRKRAIVMPTERLEV